MSKINAILPEELLYLTNDLVAICGGVYLVGGAVRNILLGKKIQDFDFVVQKKSIQAAKFVADKLDGDFYILDQKRKTSRALVPIKNQKIKFDFALFNGDDILTDLKARDFTVNALAIKFPISDSVLDPTGGQQDLQSNTLSPCSATSFIDDPVRVIRATRFSQEFELHISDETHQLIAQAAPKLDRVSSERKRDAVLDVIRTADVKAAFNQMLALGVFAQIFPDGKNLTEIDLTPPHTYNAWDHTMQVVHYCQQIMALLGLAPALEDTHHRISQAVERFQPFLQQIQKFFEERFIFDRSQYQLLIISALFHDAAKAVVAYEFSGQRKRFPDHALVGADLVEAWAQKMGFSKKETRIMRSTVRKHMRPSRSRFRDPQRKNVAIYRLFKKSGPAGIHIAMLHLADVLTTYENSLTDERWEEALLAVDNIFDAFFNRYDQIISPPRLLNGSEILDVMQLKQGKQIGDLVEFLTEAQVAGIIHTREEAVNFLQNQVDSDLKIKE